MNNCYLFEVSWEVCNKVGGIYTVLKSKASHIKAQFKDNYYLIGPYFPDRKVVEFGELPPIPVLKPVFDKLLGKGIICHFGQWLIPSSPTVILIDFSGYLKNTNQLKAWLWEKYRIDSLGSDFYDYDQPIVWGFAVAELIAAFRDFTKSERLIVHCHEWLSAGAALGIKGWNIPAKVVFTTHATVLGRTIAGTRDDFYQIWDNIDADREAYNYRVHTKHLTEKAMARNVDMFTTVSEITGMEAGKFLGRKPDFILPNGLDLSSFPTFEEISIKHKLFKRKIKEFMLYTLFPYYSFNIEESFIFFTASRYEFHGKGLDVFIKALSYVDRALTKEYRSKTIATFFWVPAMDVRGIHPEVLENKTYYEDIKESIVSEIPEIEERLIYRLVANKKITKRDLFSDKSLSDLKKKLKRFKRQGSSPRLCSHIIDEAHDPILNEFRVNNLLNKESNAVKVFLYPIYLTGADGILDLTYYECILGSQFGIFPSYYEPWGYTPVEAASLGSITLTTDLSGFGRHFLNHYRDKANKGIYVLKRYGLSDREFVKELANQLYKFALFSRDTRIDNKIAAKSLSKEFDWSKLVKNYFKVYEALLKH